LRTNHTPPPVLRSGRGRRRPTAEADNWTRIRARRWLEGRSSKSSGDGAARMNSSGGVPVGRVVEVAGIAVDTVDTNTAQGLPVDSRNYGTGARSSPTWASAGSA
jgi:hypothetical protein